MTSFIYNYSVYISSRHDTTAPTTIGSVDSISFFFRVEFSINQYSKIPQKLRAISIEYQFELDLFKWKKKKNRYQNAEQIVADYNTGSFSLFLSIFFSTLLSSHDLLLFDVLSSARCILGQIIFSVTNSFISVNLISQIYPDSHPSINCFVVIFKCWWKNLCVWLSHAYVSFSHAFSRMTHRFSKSMF